MKGILFAIAIIFGISKLIAFIVKQVHGPAPPKPRDQPKPVMPTEPLQKEEPTPVKSTPYSIDINEYERYIVTSGLSLDFIRDKIQEYGELPGKADQQLNFGHATINGFEVIRVPSDMLHGTYHNLLGWMSGFDEDAERPNLFFGVAINIVDRSKDYAFTLSGSNAGDEVCGLFQNGKQFTISLPNVFGEPDQVHIQAKPVIPETSLHEYLHSRGFQLDSLTEGDATFTVTPIPFHSDH